MSQFLYYNPGQPPADDLTAWGLSHLGKASELARSGSEVPGPDGGSGRLYAINDSVRIRYLPDKQTWRKAPGGKFWAGFDHDARPTPQSLLLADALPGVPVKLLDGNVWDVLQARRYTEKGLTHALPRRLTLDESGKWIQGDVTKDIASSGTSPSKQLRCSLVISPTLLMRWPLNAW